MISSLRDILSVIKTRLKHPKYYIREVLYKTGLKKSHKYFIIHYGDSQSCGWTVWERVVLYNSIYAIDNGMIPIIDMQTRWNIYLEENEVGKVNSWEKFYRQPMDITLAECIKSNDFEEGSYSQEWFNYVRSRKLRIKDNEYLRACYQKYVRYNEETEDKLNKLYSALLVSNGLLPDARLIGVCMRGSDYKQFHHMKQPPVEYVRTVVDKNTELIHCDGIFIATEDAKIMKSIKATFNDYKIISYKAGEIDYSSGLIGRQIRQSKSADEAGFDYLFTLYALNKCSCLIGGLCGATIVAKYKRSTPYDFINVIDLKSHY